MSSVPLEQGPQAKPTTSPLIRTHVPKDPMVEFVKRLWHRLKRR